MIINKKELIIVTGVSGAGKSTAVGFLEDIGYYCIDNLPPFLMTQFLDLLSKQEQYSKIAMVIDIRTTENFESIIESVQDVERYDYDVRVVYLDIKTNMALKRYKLTRRKHPYAERFNGDIDAAITYEKDVLSPLRSRADFVIDTSDLNDSQLRNRLTQLLVGDDKDVMHINVESFGFKHGIPTEADFVIDVRCLPNPYWVEKLRSKTGLDKEVRDYVFSFSEANELLERLSSLLDFLNPLYIKEGKSQVVFAIGCTGGNHRSVAIAQALKEHFEKKWDNVSVNHRDIDRK